MPAAGEETHVRRRHLDWFADFAEHCQPSGFGPDGPAWIDRLAAELDNLRAAMTWSVSAPAAGGARAGLRTAGALQQLWLWRDNSAEGQYWLEQTLAADAAQSPTDSLETPLPAARLGAHGAHPRVLALNALSIQRRTQGRVAEAEIAAGNARDLARAVQDRRGEAHALISLGNIGQARGEDERAVGLLEEGLSIARDVGEQFATWRALTQLGLALRRLGQPEQARQRLEEALAIARAWGNVWNTAMTLRVFAQLAFDTGEDRQATALIEETLALLTRMGDARSYRELIWQLGTIALAHDDPRRAAGRFAESLKLSFQASNRGQIARCLAGVVAAARMADPAGASAPSSTTGARLLGAATGLCEATGIPMPLGERPVFEQSEAAVRADLDEDAYGVAFAEGRAMPMEQAVELALALAAEIQASSR